MTSSILKKAIRYTVGAILASFLTILFVNSSVTRTNGCELCRARSRRDAEKRQVRKEVNKNDTSNKMLKKEKVFLKKAVRTGAVCLDGSPPGYHFREGFGNGTNKWVVFFNGGAWCFDEQACYQRSHGVYGSSRFNTIFTEGGLYSNDPQTNPGFYNWNMVFIIYCDGSSFTGMRQNPVYFKDKPVYFRGKAILDAIIQDLLSRGIGSATDVLLSGSSAGSLAVLIHADFIKSRLNQKTKVRAISDGGYFVDLATQHGTNKTRDMFNRMLFTHNSTSSLHPACIKRTSVAQHWKCLLPQYFFDLVETPVFVLQSAYDIWQIVNNLDIVCTIPSYKDMLLFRSLKRLRTENIPQSRKTFHNPVETSSRNSPRGTTKASRATSRESRKKSHASRGSNHPQKLNLISVKNAQWRTSVPASNSKFVAQRVNYLVPRVQRLNYLVPRVQRVNNGGHVQPREKQYATFYRDTFANARVLTSQIPPVWRSPRWRNTLGTQLGSWNNPAMLRGPVNEVRRPNNPVYAQVKSQLSGSVKYQVLRQQNPGNTQTFPFYNIRETISTVPDANQVRAYSPRNVDHFRQNTEPRTYSPRNTEPRTYSVTNVNVAHIRLKRELLSPKSHSISAKVAQFGERRGPEKAQSDGAKSRNGKKQKTLKGWHWQTLYSSPTSCTKDETEKILNLRKLTIEALRPVITKPHTGLFLSPCFEHTQATYSSIWRNTKVEGKTLGDAIVEWYFKMPGNHIHIGPEFEFSSCTT